MQNCPECGTAFESAISTKLFCSKKCAKRKHRRDNKKRRLSYLQKLREQRTGLKPFESYCKECGIKFLRVYSGEKYCCQGCRSIGTEKVLLENSLRASERRKKASRDRIIACKYCLIEFKPEYTQKYCSSDCQKEAARERAQNRDPVEKRAKRYGLTVEEFNSLGEQQQWKCGICLENRELVIDHCHDSNQVRGLLCSQCNSALGFFRDNISNFERAIKYLETSRV